VQSLNIHTDHYLSQAPRFPSSDGGWPDTPKLAGNIRDLFAAVGSQTSLRVYLEHVVQVLVSLFEAEGCTISLLEQGDVATSKAAPADGVASSTRQGVRAEIQMEAALERLLETKTAVFLPAADLQATDKGSRVGTFRGHAMLSPIIAGESVLGMVVVVCSGPDSRFDRDKLHLLEAIALYLGQALYARRLSDLLNSRLLHLALTSDVGRTVNQIRLGSVPALDKMTRIVAKSFFREMTKAGFGSHQIIRAATEIISELHSHLQKRSAPREESVAQA